VVPWFSEIVFRFLELLDLLSRNCSIMNLIYSVHYIVLIEKFPATFLGYLVIHEAYPLYSKPFVRFYTLLTLYEYIEKTA
jgi:hypothetical protein